jgi:ATP-dependent RNA helicase RhlE
MGQKIDPLKYVHTAEIVEEAAYIPTHQFSDFLVADILKGNIASKGYTQPTPIQDEAIQEILDGKDVIGLANTGTGKTAAFLIPLINKVYYNHSERILVVVPTRELAVQIQDEWKEFTRGMSLYSVLCIGGAGMQQQIHGLRRDPHIVIATPGRLKDLEKQGFAKLFLYNNIVLDEVDRMMDMGFINDIRLIISKLPAKRQSLFFSATMPDEIHKLAFSFLRNPITISVKTSSAKRNIEQQVVHMQGRQKVDVLMDLLSKEEFKRVIVFGRTKWGMEKVSKILLRNGFRVAAIHGNKSQGQRQRALDEFKRGQITALLATDVASRGLDIDDVSHVINFDEPASYEDYIHRIGRTGRANRTGTALTFLD